MSGIAHQDLVEIVRRATNEVFATMLNLELTPGEAYLDHSGTPGMNGVASFIGLTGAWVGTGTICCSADFACKLSSALMMSEYASVDEDVLDAVAEVTNMIIGNVKSALEDRLGPMGISIPTVIFGRNFTSRTVGRQEWTVVPFHCEQEKMDVQVCLAPKSESSRIRSTFEANAMAPA